LIPFLQLTSLARLTRRFLAVIGLASTVPVFAHLEIEAALEQLNARITASPGDAQLFLERGELYAQHQDWISAEANFLRAAELAPSLPRLDCARGALALATGAALEACGHLNRALALNSQDAEALILRSRARAALNDRLAAEADLDAALRLLANPRPELFLERATLCASPREAIRSLDAAIARIGPVHTLQLRALELEETAGLIDAALMRLQAIAGQSERKETWLKRQGDLLARAGRAREARRSYTSALAAIAALPAWLRESPDILQLTAELTRLVPANT
jgi:tetratricopeptide (TPR) repeat protein